MYVRVLIWSTPTGTNMIIDLLKPRLLVGCAIAGFVLGGIAVFVGQMVLGPVALLFGTLCTILAAIMITTPQTEVATALAGLEASPASTVEQAEAAEQPADDRA